MNSFLRHRITHYTLATIILFFFVYMLHPFFIPILVAALLAFAVDPIVSRYKFVKRRKGIWTALLICLLFLVFLTPIVFVGARLVTKAREVSKIGFQNTPLFATLQKALISVNETITGVSRRFNLDTDSLPDPTELLSKSGALVLGGTGGLLTALPDFILSLFIFTIVLYFFLTESKPIKRFMVSLDLITPKELDDLILVVQKSSYTSFVTTVVIGMIQAAVVTLGAAICGYHEYLIVFVVTFFVSLIPVIGAAPVAIALAIVSFAQGNVAEGIGLVITGGIAGVIDNLVKPILVNSSEDDLHPVISLVTIVGAVLVYGMPGLILGPILMQLVIRGLPILFRSEKT